MLSHSAQCKLDEMTGNRMKDAFEVPEALDAILAASHAAAGHPLELPASVASDDRVDAKELRADDGTQCFLLTPIEMPATEGLTVYYHGGGFAMEIGDLHWEPCVQLALRTGAPVLVPIYPLLPDAGYREAYASAMAAYRLALELVSSANVALAGDSAGGHLALGVAQLALAEGMPVPKLVVGLSPVMDFSGEVTVDEALDEADPMLGLRGTARIAELWAQEAAMAPAFPPSLLHGPMAGLSPVRLYVGTREVLRPGVEAFAAAAQAQGVDVRLEVGEGLWHCYALMLDMEEGRAAFDDMAGSIRASLGRD